MKAGASMLLRLDGSSDLFTHVRRKISSFLKMMFKFEAAVDVNKLLKENKYLLQTTAPYSELPSNIITMGAATRFSR